MKLNIQPYVGVGPVKFGMTIHEVRKAIGQQPVPFRKTPNQLIPTDAFVAIGLHVYYKNSGICEAVEMAVAADPVFEGHHLIERPFNEVCSWLRTLDDVLQTDESGLTSLKFGIGLYAPGCDEKPTCPIEAVIVFESGYYDSE